MKIISLKYIVLASAIFTCIMSYGIEREVRIKSHKGEFELAGTLAFPPDGNAKAVIVTATGSGLQDRDETVYGHKPFKVISDSLVENGYAVLRMDDRGFGESGGDATKATTKDFADDIESGLRYVETFFQCPKGVLGHSLGGIIAPMLAAEGKVDFIITLGGPVWRGDSITMSQARKIAEETTGQWDGESTQRELLAIAGSTMPDFIARPILFEILGRELGKAVEMPAVSEQLNKAVESLLSPWYRDMLRLDPGDFIKEVKVPWLALYGEKDVQVLPKNKDTLSELNPSADIYLLNGHNHLFQDNASGMIQEYATLGVAPSDKTVAIILNWLEENFK